MLPQHLIVEFWTDVTERLQKEHGFRREQANHLITLYRQRMQAHGGDEVAYHENPEDIARALSHRGVLDPRDPTIEEMRQELTKAYPDLGDVIANEEASP